MSALTVEIPAETAVALRLGEEEVAAELRLAAAVKLYELGRLSSGAAASLAGIPRPLFLMKLADYGVDTFRQSAQELRDEVEAACEHAARRL